MHKSQLQPFQAALTDVFKVQSDIAGQVAGALDLALAPDQKQQLAERPTKNLAAYDAYLRARAIVAQDPAGVRRRIALLEEAVSSDSTFADAWSQLSSTADPQVLRSLPRTRPGCRGFVAGPGWAEVDLPPQVVRLESLEEAADALSAAATL